MRWTKKFPKRANEADFKYNTSERGYIINTIATLFKPSTIAKRGITPGMTKREIWEELFLQVQRLKDLYPESDGRLCYYCHQPWTYVVRKGSRNKAQKRGPSRKTNFSIDRLKNELTYVKGNIIFCCFACNDRKHASTYDDWHNFLRVFEEKTR